MKYLVDTNIFLEVLLQQEKKETAKQFLFEHSGEMAITDFSIHSIGILLLRLKKPELFETFLSKVLPYVALVSLPAEKYHKIIEFHSKYQLDFDDSFQSAVAHELKLIIATFDKDFNKIENQLPIIFL